MFKKYIADNDATKLWSKALDIKKDPSTRLKNLKFLMDHIESAQLVTLYQKHFSIIYHTFIETFTIFDYNSKQHKDDLDCLLFVLEKILIYNTKLLKKKWQFYSIIFVMQKLLHQHNTYKIKEEGIRLFLIWYQILSDDKNVELENIFNSLVPGIVPQNNNNDTVHLYQDNNIKLSAIEPMIPKVPNETLPNGKTEISYYLDRLLEYTISQIPKPVWNLDSPEDEQKTQEQAFAFLFSMFKKTYLVHILKSQDFLERSILINWLTKIFRQDITDRDEYVIDIARTVIGTRHENIITLHEILGYAFEEYMQPSSMKRVINLYKDWITNSNPQSKIGYSSFGELLQNFIVKSANVFIIEFEHLEEQVEVCKRILNIYRYMVMKIFMNKVTWEQLLGIMLNITKHLFSRIPHKRKEDTIGGRIAPAFFQTFIVSWIRANLYVYIPNSMWENFQSSISNLSNWIELIDEWSTTMISLTRVLVKNVYGLNLNDLPLDKMPLSRRKAGPSLSTCPSFPPPQVTTTDNKCVLLKGSVRGWTPENSVIMWCRMLSLFGNINSISNPTNHFIAIRCLANLFSDLTKARKNLCISLDNQSTPDPPILVPPSTYFAPWLFETTNMSEEYAASRLLAYQLICQITIKCRDIEHDQQYYAAFYECIHRGLSLSDEQVKFIIIKNCPLLFATELPGSTIIIYDIIEACKSILTNANATSAINFENSNDQDLELTSSLTPRDEAVTLLYSISSLSRLLKTISCLEPGSNFNLIQYDTRKAAIGTLIDFIKSQHQVSALSMSSMTPKAHIEDKTFAKCLCAFTTFVYQDLLENNEQNDKINELFKIFIDELDKKTSQAVVDDSFRICCQSINLLSDHAQLLSRSKPALVAQLLQTIACSVKRISKGKGESQSKESILSLLMCIKDWCSLVGKDFIAKPLSSHLGSSIIDKDSSEASDEESIISIVLKHIKDIADDNESFDFARQACCFIRLKLLTFIGHFPFKQLGVASTGCCIDEFDFISSNIQATISAPVNQQASVLTTTTTGLEDEASMLANSNLTFVSLNEHTIVTFVGSTSSSELNPTGHLIVRNACGKYAWDISYLYSLVGTRFDVCRQLIQQIGLLTWEKRAKFENLNKTSGFVRELRNLDAQAARETHKIAVIYIASGQEDKNSILRNSSGSKQFEEFVSTLGWQVNLASHLGFRGGLQANARNQTSVYYCKLSTEIMFHVSTQLESNDSNESESSNCVDDECLNRKLRHLGNDEVHIIWSEHSRDYRRGIIPTEFSDVIISIYPLSAMFSSYFRIQIDAKPDVPSFGPLFDCCIVHESTLGALVRATAINASRSKRLKLPHYKTHFEERFRLLESINRNHKHPVTFEDFAASLF